MPQFNIRDMSGHYDTVLNKLSVEYGVTKTDVVYRALDALKAQNDILAVLALAAKLPAGLPDPKSADKLIRERDEFREAVASGDEVGALTELADRIYYACKEIDAAASEAGVTISQAFSVCVAKYQLRARAGNPKDDEAEREACRNASA